MPSSCKDIRKSPSPKHSPPLSDSHSTGAALALCLQNSDCVLIHRNTPSDCLRPPLADTLPTQCQQLKHGYGECKKGQIDMRKRFRGNKPISTSVELEAGGGQGGEGMLYAGGNALGSGPKGTDGRGDGRGELVVPEGYEKFVRNDGNEDIRKK